jgi:hypothetical protein
LIPKHKPVGRDLGLKIARNERVVNADLVGGSHGL